MKLEIKILETISALDSDAVNALGDGDPFARFEFYHALESSGSVGENTGWQVLHLAAFGEGALLGFMPLYAKSHSYGEYVFDHAFAEAYERAGGDYYPKLLAAPPFTPVNGQRIYAQSGAVRDALVDAALAIGEQNQLSSLHINFCTAALEREDFLERDGVQYHFFNEGYSDFEEFLGELSASKRKTLRQERRAVANSGLQIEMKKGDALNAADWDCFWDCYQDTGARKWGMPYLTRAFFEEIATSMREEIVMGLAYLDGQPVATALNFAGGGRLLGRYWGALVDVKFLHFELCYYQAMDYAIAHHIPLVEAGAQGEHKVKRGYRPVITKSYHHFYEPEFQKLIKRHLRGERSDMAYYKSRLEEELPFRREP